MLSRIGTGLAAAVALFLLYRLYTTGHPVLAAAGAGGFGLAFFVFTARRTYTYRYLFPGLTGIALFIVLPLVYTVWIGFTNYGSRNLLTFERATEVLLGEVYQSDSARYQFSLYADGDGYRIVLEADEESPAEGVAPPLIPSPSSEAAGAANGSNAGSADGAANAGSANAAAGSANAGSANAGSAEAAPAVPATPPEPPAPRIYVSPKLPLSSTTKATIAAVALAGSGFTPGEPVPLKEIIARSDALKAVTLTLPGGGAAAMSGLREFTPFELLYKRNADGSLTNQQTHERLVANHDTGFYEKPDGARMEPGFRTYVGGANYKQVFTERQFRGPFFRVFAWTVVFAGLTVLFTAALGLFLAELLASENLRFVGVYRVLLFLPYAVPGFISILVFKGLFNRNFGEINMILDALLGIRPNWTGNAMLARAMILIVNTWLGYPYFMLLGMGLQKSIPKDLYEASALAGAGPLTTFWQITWPLIKKPLTPLMISTFAFNFNNFVLIYLLTRGRPDFLDTTVPVGETDILVSYTYRIAFEDSGQNFGLAATISTIIFALVGILSVVNLRLTKANAEERR